MRTRRIFEVDKPLYEYIKNKAPVTIDQAKLYNGKVLGYTANQFTVSLSRLIEQKYVMKEEDKFMPTRKFKKRTMVLYPCLTDEFIQAWDKYLDHRRDLKKPYVSVGSEQKQLNFYWAEAGENVALFVKGVEYAINKNWIGVDYGIREVLKQGTESTIEDGVSTSVSEVDEYLDPQ